MGIKGLTSLHLMGFFYRTIRMVENGIKPLYVFDGKPPELKAGVLSKRLALRKEAQEEGEEAKETGTAEDVDRFARRTVKVTREHNEECRRLLGLMGIPFVVVYAAGSEDMDTLTFHAPVLLRHLTFSEARKTPISEINLDKALEGLEMNMSQFIELCILLGCDYLEPIKGVGPKSALKLIREHGNLGAVIEHLREKTAAKEDAAKDEDGKKKKGGIVVPEEWPWEEAKKFFEHPDVTPAKDVEVDWTSPDVEGLVQFLVTEKGFNEDRVRKGADKLSKFLNTKQQGRLDGFFTAKPKTEPKKGKETEKGKKGTKRKADDKDKKDAGSSKKSKTKK
ncbi:hypothetical protein EVJ58_g3848 [Rhodofomes roseus]|uniref:Flap endonuclease 1 n=1 Tax=Rhodofomes roseus TaxID=34475 RepID=A0A4Y9YL75_9APHY|nr:hypothetical protein EVJ58_g3848 [Rhodofomes roseus]